MILKYYAIYILMIFFVSCTNKTEYNDCSRFELDENLKKQTQLLIGNPLKFDLDVNKPVRIFSFDSLLILTNMNTELLLDIYNTNNNKKICSNISTGSGPNELLIVNKIQHTDSSLLLFDQMKGKIFEYSKDKFYTQNPQPSNITNLEIPANNILKLPSGDIIATTFNEENKRFSIFNSKGELIKHIGNYPDYNENLSMYEQIESFMCDMALIQSNIVLTYKRTDLVEIYDLAGNLKKRIHGPDLFFPAIEQRNNGEEIRFATKKGQSRDAYFYPVGYNNEIWTLYSGRSFDPNGSPIYLNNTILVFDSSGEILKQYKLDTPIFTFTINTKNKKLYGITDNPEMQIIEYNLDKL